MGWSEIFWLFAHFSLCYSWFLKDEYTTLLSKNSQESSVIRIHKTKGGTQNENTVLVRYNVLTILWTLRITHLLNILQSGKYKTTSGYSFNSDLLNKSHRVGAKLFY